MAAPVSDPLDQIKIIDTDTHIIEPYDLWTSRVSRQRWGNMVPHVDWSEAEQQDVWITHRSFRSAPDLRMDSSCVTE
jgi:hypothetical protein